MVDKLNKLSIFSFNTKTLPILNVLNKLKTSLKNTKDLIIFGETGSGKSTKIPQIILTSKLNNNKVICCTQPRRLAAVSLALRVSKELKDPIGNIVGFAIRFEENISINTKIKFCTDGVLLKECCAGNSLRNYSYIIIDEAHERTINTDIVLGICKIVSAKKKDIHIIVTSATLDIRKFSKFFNKCPVFAIPGISYRVKIYYLKQFENDYVRMAIRTITQISQNEKTGDILCFLTGRADIEFTESLLYLKIKHLNLKILKIYSNLPIKNQVILFKDECINKRRCVLSTNLTETSLTIPNIRYVVDCGFCKAKFYDPKTRTEILSITPISKSSASQRSGRAGRLTSGKSFRLYTQYIYRFEMQKSAIPEILRANLITLVLLLKSLKFENVFSFDFIDKPSFFSISNALEELFILQALNKNGQLTNIGKIMSIFPLDPKLSKSLLIAITLKAPVEVSIIIGLVSNQTKIFIESVKHEYAIFHRKFYSNFGDHLTYLNVYKAWVKQNYSDIWSETQQLNYICLTNAKKIAKQLLLLIKKFNIIIEYNVFKYTRICKSFTGGYCRNVAKKIKENYYKVLNNRQVFLIHPSSHMKIILPDLAVFQEIISSGRSYIYNVNLTIYRFVLQKNTGL